MGYQIILFTGILSANDDVSIRYNYQYDSNGYQNHQITTDVNYDKFEFIYQHNQTTEQSQFWYDSFYGIYKFNFNRLVSKIGFGGIYGDNWGYVPAYIVNFRYGDWEFNAQRSPVGAVLNNVPFGNTPYSRVYVDDLILSKDFNITKNYSFVVAGMFSEFGDNNNREGFLIKNRYNFTENLGIYLLNKIWFYDHKSSNYFSPYNYQIHTLAFQYGLPLFNDNALFNVKVGPTLVYINGRSEIHPYYDIGFTYNTEERGKFNIGYSCQDTVYNYSFCQAGINYILKF